MRGGRLRHKWVQKLCLDAGLDVSSILPGFCEG